MHRQEVEGDGFEPSKAMPADLQSAPFGRSGNPPKIGPAARAFTLFVRLCSLLNRVDAPPRSTSSVSRDASFTARADEAT